MGRAAGWIAIFLLALLPRLTHSRILWVEEAYPAAAAIQSEFGKLPYRDFFFDKPPLAALFYAAFGVPVGWPLRVLGALFVLLCSWLLFRVSRQLWGEREAWFAAALGAFFLTFAVPSAAMALAPDLLLVAPHVAAIALVASGRPLSAGILCGVALGFHVKGLFVLAACLAWRPRDGFRIVTGLTASTAALLLMLAGYEGLGGYWSQVWEWGSMYSRSVPADSSPVVEGLRRTANWLGFHAALAVGAIIAVPRAGEANRTRMLVWMLLCGISVAMGGRFFPRYYFHLLPPLVVLGARGIALLPTRGVLLALALLVIPGVRYGSRFATLASDLAARREHDWSDLALNRDSKAAAEAVTSQAKPGDTILVWGYRPDILVYTRLPLGAPYLDSQPLTGVLADRHLRSTAASVPELAAANRTGLTQHRPTWIVDGLGPYNPNLAIDRFEDLQTWLANYDVAARTEGATIWRLR